MARKGTSSPPPKPTRQQKIRLFALAHRRILTLVCGMVIVASWTLYRHISNGVNFDVVGQIGLAQQWNDGLRSGAQLGATNYIVKIPLYILVNHFGFMTPMNRLLLLALILNLATYVLLFVLYEKLLKLYEVPGRAWLSLAFLWLAAIAGNVLWADYANSRNLETVGGILFMYIALKYAHDQNKRFLPLLIVTGSVVFFADSLQFYVCGVGVCLYALCHWALQRQKSNAVTAGSLIVATLAAWLGAKFWFWAVRHYLHVTFLAAPITPVPLSLAWLGATAKALATNTFKIFGADVFRRPYTVSSLRELVNFAAFMLCAVLCVRLVHKRNKNVLFSVVATIIAVNYGVFAASGQATGWETSRYLVMVPLVGVLIAVLGGGTLSRRHQRAYQYAWLSLIVVSTIMLWGALLVGWPQRHSKDQRIYALASAVRHNNWHYAFGSRADGIVGTYFAQGASTIVPMACQPDHSLQPTYLFYDRAALDHLYNYNNEVPIIVPPGGIAFGTNTCTAQNVIKQFGAPLRQQTLPNVGTALVYLSRDVRNKVGIVHTVKTPAAHPAVLSHNVNTLPPAKVDALPDTIRFVDCPHGTVDVTVAHPDDDILFMNPDLATALQSRYCVRTIYVTAADDGKASDYWRNRERGIEAAYAYMLGVPSSWNQKTENVAGLPLTYSTLVAEPNVSLIFLRLPDGAVSGKGFSSTGHVSLLQAAHNDAVLKSVDGKEKYTYTSVVQLITDFIANDKPSSIFTQLANGPYTQGDHSDHTVVGQITLEAASKSQTNASIAMYMGYPSNGLPANLAADDAAYKKSVFLKYAFDDAAICGSKGDKCVPEGTYGRYFSRSYKTSISVNHKTPAPTLAKNQVFELFHR